MINQEQHRQLREDGFCIVENVLVGDELTRAQAALDEAVERMRRQDKSTYDDRLDPNASSIRVYNLPEHDPVFMHLLHQPVALDAVQAVLGPNILVSNFTANIALPGAGSMNIHSDQALVIPAPWNQPWAMNVVWCLDDIYADNGATRYLPGSHHFRTFEDVPADAATRMRAFEASAGSFIAMEGRLWHTSGANITKDKQRRQMFAYYSMDFIRPQINWEAILSPETKDSLDEDMRKLMGLGGSANTRIGGAITRRETAKK